VSAHDDVIWRPDPAAVEASALARFADAVEERHGTVIGRDYRALHRWSIADPDAFWAQLWDFFAIESTAQYTAVMGRREMPGAEWFPGAQLNFAQHILRLADRAPSRIAIHHADETRSHDALNWGGLAAAVARCANALKGMGIGPGDAVAGYLTNRPEAVIAMLAAASCGAVWTSCPPEFGTGAVLDRFEQVAPKILFVVGGYRFGGKEHDRKQAVADLVAGLPTLRRVIEVGAGEHDRPHLSDAVSWTDALSGQADRFEPSPVPFDHPLFVCFSSGTTGKPKAIVHGHGGVLLEGLKIAVLHEDRGPTSVGLHYTTTGWIVWNMWVVAPLLCGGAVVTYDGNPLAPDATILLRLAERTGVTHFGGSPGYFAGLVQRGIDPNTVADLAGVKAVNLTGAPVSADIMHWVARHFGSGVHVCNVSGGTEVCTALLGSNRWQPARAGRFQGPGLAIDVAALNHAGESVIGEVGELVVRQPIPTMPLRFLDDPGDVRLRETYFETFPGLWRHGDFFCEDADGSSTILGRSDATLNRNGVRIGTAEFYRILDAEPRLADALVINLERADGSATMILFVELASGQSLDTDLERAIINLLREQGSPRHVPDRIIAVPAIPYTITGKKLEIPVKRILMGRAATQAASIDTMRNPESLAFFEAFAS